MERLDKQVKSTLKQAFIELLAPKALQEDIRKFYNRELKLEECAEVRKKAIEELLSKIDQLTNDIYEQYDVSLLFYIYFKCI
jgi:phosphoribosyl-dephospho-CoA transferase